MKKKPIIIRWLLSKRFYAAICVFSVGLLSLTAYDYVENRQVSVVMDSEVQLSEEPPPDVVSVSSHGLPTYDYSWKGLQVVPPDQWTDDDMTILFPQPFVDLNVIQSYGLDYDDIQEIVSEGLADPDSAELLMEVLDKTFSTPTVQVQEYVPPVKKSENTKQEIRTDLASVIEVVNNKLNWDAVKHLFKTDVTMGSVTIPKLGVTGKPIRYGGQDQINKGICLYYLTDPLGIVNGTTMLAAHNYNPNWKIGNLEIGDKLYIETPYGKYVYTVYNTRINYDGRDDYWFNMPYWQSGKGDLVLMTCYPFDNDGSNGQRYLVNCRKESGPVVEGYDSLWDTYEDFEDWRKNSP